MPFQKADFVNATQGGQFISDLMPKYPIYTNILDPRAQEVIGKPLHASLPAMQMLEAEGLRYQGYVDIFDAGPTLQSQRVDLRTVRKSKLAKLVGTKALGESHSHLICNTSLANLRMVNASLEVSEAGVAMAPDVAEALNVKVGGEVRYVE